MKKAISIHNGAKVLHSIGRLLCLPWASAAGKYKGLPLLLAIAFLVSGCRFGDFPWNRSKRDSGVILQSAQYSGKIRLLLYFPDPAQSYLVPEDRIAEFDSSLEKTVMKELLKGPKSAEASPVPKGTKLLGIERNGDTITVNLSGEFKKNHPGGGTGELMSIYTIVNSLTEIPGVIWVQFKIDGRFESSLTGHMTFNKPIARNRALLKRNKTLNPSQVLKLQMVLESQGKWLDAYMLLSDDPGNHDRKYYSDYYVEMEEVKQLGFTNQKFEALDYTLDETGAKARVRVDFYTFNPDGSKNIINTAYFNTVKIKGVWLVDWSTAQGDDATITQQIP